MRLEAQLQGQREPAHAQDAGAGAAASKEPRPPPKAKVPPPPTIISLDLPVVVKSGTEVNLLYVRNTTVPIAVGDAEVINYATVPYREQVYASYFLTVPLSFGLMPRVVPSDAAYGDVLARLGAGNPQIIAGPNSFWDDLVSGFKSALDIGGKVASFL